MAGLPRLEVERRNVAAWTLRALKCHSSLQRNSGKIDGVRPSLYGRFNCVGSDDIWVRMH